MKAYLSHLLAGTEDIAVGLPIVREYLQARILEGLQQAGAFMCISFHGGTSLRFLYDVPRFSEDLDFALEDLPTQFDFHGYLGSIRRSFEAENYFLDIRATSAESVVQKGFIRFPGLLHELELSPYPDQAVAVKIEIDTNAPAHAVSETTLLRRHIDLHLRHHDRATLLAGKLQAILNRMFVKGRDWYDLWWYLEQPDWPLPNFAYLNSGLRQANYPTALSEENWRAVLRKKTEGLNWSIAYNDVEPFLLEVDARFNKERLLDLLRISD